MTDIVKIAKARRARLAAEVYRLENFIRMADVLKKFAENPMNGVAFGPARPDFKAMAVDHDPVTRLITAERRTATSPVAALSRFKEADSVTAPAAPIAAPAIAAPVEPDTKVSEPAPEQEVAETAEGPANAEDKESLDKSLEEKDTFFFSEPAAERDEALVLTDPVADIPADEPRSAAVDIHIGQKLRQRRWMVGMSRQQLGAVIGVDSREIQAFEMGSAHISTRRIYDVATALKVPVTYFFEEIAGQQGDGADARGEVLSEREALALVHGGLPERTAKAS